MSDTIRIKRRTSGAAGPPTQLANAELAFNEVDETLYIGKGGTPTSAASIIPIGGTSFAGGGGGGGNVSNAGTPANGQWAQWTDATHIQGVPTASMPFEVAANKGTANGYASLDATTKVPAAQLPSYVDDVVEYANLAAFPATGSAGIIYVALDTNKIYRWSGSVYVEISPSPGSTDAVPEGSVNLYFTNERVDDRAAALIQNGTGITWNYNDAAGTLTPTVTAGAGPFQPLDADLSSIGSFGGSNQWLYRSAVDTWSPVTIGSGLSFSSGTLAATNAGSVVYRYSTTTTPPPASGYLRGNNASAASVTALYVNNVADGGTDVKRILMETFIGDIIIIQEESNSANYADFQVTANPIDQTTYVELPVVNLESGGALTNNARILFVRRGAKVLPEAPMDGTTYGRKDGIWSPAQPLDADLTSLAAASAVGAIYYRSAANTWATITIGTGLTFTSGTLDAPVFTSSAKGEVPASGGGTANFLRADGTWAVPPTGSGGITDAPSDGNVYGRLNATWDNLLVRFAPLASPAFTGTPTAPTAAPGTNTTVLATTAFATAADNAVKSQLIGSASTGMDTMGEIENYIQANIMPTLGNKADLFSPTFTGDPKAPTPATSDNDTSISTTAYVQANLANYQPLDADLTAIAALTGTNVIYYRSAANTWAAVTIGTGLTFSAGTLSATGGGTGNVSNSGTPAVNQLAVWTDATHVKGDANLTWAGTTLTVAGTVAAIPSGSDGAQIGGAATQARFVAAGASTDIGCLYTTKGAGAHYFYVGAFNRVAFSTNAAPGSTANLQAIAQVGYSYLQNNPTTAPIWIYEPVLLNQAGNAIYRDTYSARGLTADAINTSTCTITFREAVLRDANGMAVVVKNFSANCVTNAAVGANGPDGTITNGDVHFYAIWGATPGGATICSMSSPSTGPTLPTNYTHWAYCTTIKVISGALASVYTRGSWCYYSSFQSILSGGNSASWASVSTAAYVPAIALNVLLNISATISTGAGSCGIQWNVGWASGGTEYVVRVDATGPSAIASAGGHGILPNISQTLWYAYSVLYSGANATSNSLNIFCAGYQVPNGS